MSNTHFLPDAAATERLGAALAATCPVRAVVYLQGDLGAGKTTLARALLRTLGVTGPVRSPTYALLERYALAGGDAVHLDLYRIADPEELQYLGLDDIEATARLWLVEWAERGRGALPAADLQLSLALKDSGREVRITALSPVGEIWLRTLRDAGHMPDSVIS